MSIGELRRRPGYLGAAAAFAAFMAVVAVGWTNATRSGTAWGPDAIDLVYDVGGGLTFAVVGFTVWWRRPRNVAGPLMIVIAVALMSPIFEWLPVPPLVTFGQATWGAPSVLIGALLLLYPTGRGGSRAELAWLVGAVGFLVLGVVHAMVTPIGKWDCSQCRSWIVLNYDENLSNNVWLVQTQLLALLGIALVALLVRRWRRASRPTRRVMAPLWVSGLAFVAVVLFTTVLDTSGLTVREFSSVPNVIGELRLRIPAIIWTVFPYVATAALFLIPLALGWGQVRLRWGQVAVSSLAIELNRTDRRPLVDSLRRALDDPSLDLALWSRPARAYVTPDGLPMPLPADDSHDVTHLSADDGPLAAIVHDPALSEQRRLIDGVAAVAQLAIENERLHAEVKAQLEEVRASRQRIVSAADAERRRVERNIHDGAQQRLVSLSMALRLAQAQAADASPEVAGTLADAEAELKHAIGELRELARGIHPAILTEAGLGAALESLAERAALPVAVDTRLNGRLPPVVEATAYFLVAEALTNVVKHAGATAATVRATVKDGTLRVRVADNGSGGVDLDRGSGVRGLIDRVAALGGNLTISDDPQGGTVLEADIPCA
ncbi:MAG TPA: sensor histidine kinase [Candidatus Limnocylindria bacterium]|nr:sensor histidine kinase [Candidatus Limnocylindria bacterium]